MKSHSIIGFELVRGVPAIGILAPHVVFRTMKNRAGRVIRATHRFKPGGH